MKTPAQKRKDRKKSHVPFRLNLLFFIVFILFSSLILRLGYLQIIRTNDYQAEVERTDQTTITGSVPRGEIYDSNLRNLVGNEARNTITYTRGRNVSSSQMAETAFDLAEYISMPNATEFEVDSGIELRERDLKDYFISMNQEEVRSRLTDEELELDGSESYQAMIEKVSQDEIQSFSEREKDATAIFKQMNSAYSLSTINIKNEDVSQEEIARVSENLDSLAGIDTGTDWVRTYPEGSMLSSVLGSVTSEEQGVSEDKLKTYLARGYSRNDRVGNSNLESQYESVLRGSKSRIDTETNSNGEIINQVEQYHGEKGDNLILTIDIDFQETVEQIARDSLAERQGLSDGIYIAAMNPKNGDVLAMTGQQINDNGEISDNALGVIQNSFSMGSSVKGATLLAASMDGVLDSSNNVMVDSPIQIQGSNNIRSLFNRTGSVTVNDLDALEVSSNVYMAYLAMRMGGVWNHEPNEAIPINGQDLVEKQRHYFEQFGLGIETGIDLPNETTGYLGYASNPGQALFHSFGQFDTYTTMQLLQHMATIANDGTRIAPRLVSEIRGTDPENGGIGPLKSEIPTKPLNHLDVSDEALDRVHEGLYRVINGDRGTGRFAFNDTSYTAAGKTGTAETWYWDEELEQNTHQVINMTFAGYAPYDDPEIAVAVVVPYLPFNDSERTNTENTRAARRVFDAYFKTGEFEEDSEATIESIEDLENEIEE